MGQRTGRNENVFRHRSVETLESEHVVGFAHPVDPTATVEALAAGHDLLTREPVAQLDAAGGEGAFACGDHCAHELMARDAVLLGPSRLVLAEIGRASCR